MTPRLLLNSTKPKDYARNAIEVSGVWGVCVCVCVLILYPAPLVFIAGSHGVSAANPPQTDVGDQCHAAT